ncbi:MAG: class I SAM-dependent methyltransferase [Bacteroidota bacterium]|nr:class I SAM-dependent methyltransferase [Bacteroidota bacterium]
MEVFDAYAKYYDLLYRDKDYFREAEYIVEIIRRVKPGANKILDIGCGTGRHDIYFAEKNYDVTGIDLSEAMISEANNNLSLLRNNTIKLKFKNGDMRNIRLNEEFDIITSLFHVMSYQTTNEDLMLSLKTVRKHLRKDGKFIFDFWYGPAVLNEKPERRVKKLEDSEYTVERFADPVLKENENVVDVNYRVLVLKKENTVQQEINETHSMRYFFLPEVRLLLESADLKMEHFEEWQTGNSLSIQSWNALVVAGIK